MLSIQAEATRLDDDRVILDLNDSLQNEKDLRLLDIEWLETLQNMLVLREVLLGRMMEKQHAFAGKGSKIEEDLDK